jgi:hypothetical protein
MVFGLWFMVLLFHPSDQSFAAGSALRYLSFAFRLFFLVFGLWFMVLLFHPSDQSFAAGSALRYLSFTFAVSRLPCNCQLPIDSIAIFLSMSLN